MNRTLRRCSALVTLVAFSAVCFAPRGAAADEVPGDVPRAQPPQPPQPPRAPAPQAYPAYPQQPGYPAQPGYPQYPVQPAYPQQPTYPQYPPNYQYPTYPQAQPARMKLVERPRIGMAIAGASIFGGIWLTTSMIGYSSGNNAAIIPVIGPLFYLRSDDECCSQSSNRAANVGLMMVTLAQATGVALFVAGLVTKQKVWVRETELSVLPTALPGGGGLAAVGRF